MGWVSDGLLEAYWKFLAEGHCPDDDIEAFFGDVGLLDTLITSRIAHLQSSGPTQQMGYVAASPIPRLIFDTSILASVLVLVLASVLVLI